MFKRMLLLLLLSLCLISTPAAAQDMVALEYGVPVIGELSALQNTITYTFNGSAGDTVYLTMRPVDGVFEVQMRLFDPDDQLIAESDYGGEVQVIGPLTLNADGNYSVLAGRPDWAEGTGSFSIMVDEASYHPLDLSTAVTDRLDNASEIRFFTFQVPAAGDLFSLGVAGEMMHFVLRSPQGDYLLDNGTFDDPGLPIYQAPEGGEYTLLVQSIAADGTDFTALVEMIEPLPLVSGETVSGTINSGQPAFFAFETLGGKPWQIDAVLPDFGDRYMQIYHLDGREWWDAEIAADWGSGPNNNPRIAPFIAPEDATYYVLLSFRSFTSESSGAYEITVTPETVLSLAPGTPVTETINEATGDLTYNYNGKAGDTVEVTLTQLSETGALSLNVYSSEDEVLFFYGRATTGATFAITLPLDGLYQFIVRNVGYGEEDLTFSLLLEMGGQ